MKNVSNTGASPIPGSTAPLAIAAAVAVVMLLAGLHILSPEFDPSWRMVSEYANGQYSGVLSLMFISWAVSSWALAFTIWSQVETRAGKAGVVFLVAAGVGEAMASVFDINHSLHSVAAMIGILSLPIAAMLISVSLSRTRGWSAARKELLWAANLTWMSLVLMIATFVILMVTYTRAGGDMTAQASPLPPSATLPPGVVALVGWANRLLILVYCGWVVTVAGKAIRLRGQKT